MAGGRQKDYQGALTAGHALAWDGFWESAADAYRRAVALAPQEPAARAYLGMALLCLGVEEEAAAELREALRLQPGNALLTRKLAALERPAVAPQLVESPPAVDKIAVDPSPLDQDEISTAPVTALAPSPEESQPSPSIAEVAALPLEDEVETRAPEPAPWQPAHEVVEPAEPDMGLVAPVSEEPALAVEATEPTATAEQVPTDDAADSTTAEPLDTIEAEPELELDTVLLQEQAPRQGAVVKPVEVPASDLAAMEASTPAPAEVTTAEPADEDSVPMQDPIPQVAGQAADSVEPSVPATPVPDVRDEDGERPLERPEPLLVPAPGEPAQPATAAVPLDEPIEELPQTAEPEARLFVPDPGEAQPLHEPAVTSEDQAAAVETRPEPPQEPAPAQEPTLKSRQPKRSWWRSLMNGRDQPADVTEPEVASAEPAESASVEEPATPAEVASAEPAESASVEESAKAAEVTVEVVASEPVSIVAEEGIEPAPTPPVVDWREEWARANYLLEAGQVSAAMDSQLAALRSALGQNGAVHDAARLLQLPGMDEFAVAEATGLAPNEAFDVVLALARGSAFVDRGLWATAREVYETAIGVAPTYLPVQVAMADLFERWGKGAEAREKIAAIVAVCEVRGHTEMAERLRAKVRVA